MHTLESRNRYDEVSRYVSQCPCLAAKDGKEICKRKIAFKTTTRRTNIRRIEKAIRNGSKPKTSKPPDVLRAGREGGKKINAVQL